MSGERPSTGGSEGDGAKENPVGVKRCGVVKSIGWVPVDCVNSGRENELKVKVGVVSATLGTGSSNRVFAFLMRSAKTRPFECVS
jgi:hypothetical protein